MHVGQYAYVLSLPMCDSGLLTTILIDRRDSTRAGVVPRVVSVSPRTALYAPDLVDEMTFFSSLAFQTPPSRRLSRLKTRAFPWRRVFRPLLAKAGLVDAEIIA